jgi:hypothetical protein
MKKKAKAPTAGGSRRGILDRRATPAPARVPTIPKPAPRVERVERERLPPLDRAACREVIFDAMRLPHSSEGSLNPWEMRFLLAVFARVGSDTRIMEPAFRSRGVPHELHKLARLKRSTVFEMLGRFGRVKGQAPRPSDVFERERVPPHGTLPVSGRKVPHGGVFLRVLVADEKELAKILKIEDGRTPCAGRPARWTSGSPDVRHRGDSHHLPRSVSLSVTGPLKSSGQSSSSSGVRGRVRAPRGGAVGAETPRDGHAKGHVSASSSRTVTRSTAPRELVTGAPSNVARGESERRETVRNGGVAEPRARAPGASATGLLARHADEIEALLALYRRHCAPKRRTSVHPWTDAERATVAAALESPRGPGEKGWTVVQLAEQVVGVSGFPQHRDFSVAGLFRSDKGIENRLAAARAGGLDGRLLLGGGVGAPPPPSSGTEAKGEPGDHPLRGKVAHTEHVARIGDTEAARAVKRTLGLDAGGE